MNQINNPDYESIDPKHKKRAEIKLFDLFSIISVVFAIIAFVVSSDFFNVQIAIETGVYYSVGFSEVVFLVAIVFAAVLASVEERTLLGKASLQFCMMTLVGVFAKFLGYIILGVAVSSEYVLPRLVLHHELGFNMFTALAIIVSGMITIVICNIISGRKNVAHKKVGSAVPYILMCTMILLHVYPVIQKAIRLNAYLLKTLLKTHVNNALDTSDIANLVVFVLCIIAVLSLGFVSKDEIRRFVCGVNLVIFVAGLLINNLVSENLLQFRFFLNVNPTVDIVICAVIFVVSAVLIFLSSQKFIKKKQR